MTKINLVVVRFVQVDVIYSVHLFFPRDAFEQHAKTSIFFKGNSTRLFSKPSTIRVWCRPDQII